MSHPKARPVVIFALIQLAIVFIGILAVGVSGRIERELSSHPPSALSDFIRNHGPWLGLVPLVWLGTTLTVLHSRRTGALVEWLFVFGGVALAVGLAALMFRAVHTL